MRRARKFYGILESQRQVVGGDDYKRDIGKEEERIRERERERGSEKEGEGNESR